MANTTIFGKSKNSKSIFDSKSNGLFSKNSNSIFGSSKSKSGTSGLPTPDQSALDVAFTGLGKPLQYVENIVGDTLGLDATKNITFGDITTGRKVVSTDEVKDELFKKIGINITDKMKEGIGGTLANAALNFTLDVALDPLTYVGLGFAGKAITGTSTASKTIKTALGLKAAELGITGALIGGLGTRFDGNNDTRDFLRNVGAGAIAGGVSSIVTKEGLPIIKGFTDSIYDAYGKATLGSKYFKLIDDYAVSGLKDNILTPSKAFMKEKVFRQRAGKFKDFYLDRRLGFLENLKAQGGDELVKRFDDLSQSAFQEQIIMRNQMADSLWTRLNKAPLKEGEQAISKLSASELASVTAASNNKMGQLIDAKLKSIGDHKLTKSVNTFVKDNRELIKTYNIHKVNSIDDIIPVDFHTVDMKMPDQVMRTYNIKGAGNTVQRFVKRVSEEVSNGGISLEARMKVGADRYMEAFANKVEKRSIDINRAINLSGFTGIFGKAGEKMDDAINGWDRYRRFWKSSVLLGSSSWIKNNMFENSIRAAMKLGLVDGSKVIWSQTPMSGMFQKLFKMADPVHGFSNIPINDSEIMLANRLGVIETNFFNDVLARSSKEVKLAQLMSMKAATDNPEDIAFLTRKIEKATSGKVMKGVEAYEKMLNDTVGRFGGTVENGIRTKFFNEIVNRGVKENSSLTKLIEKEGLLKAHELSPELQDIAKKAKDMTNETFFDYSNLSAFETKVGKRIIPFYSFKSKNLAFWINHVSEDGQAVAKAAAIIRATGRTPTNDERKGIPDWMLNKMVTISNDGKSCITTPNFSLVDAFESFSAKNFGSNLDPVLKTIAEQLSNNEFGLNQPVRPSGSDFGTKMLFSRGLMFQDAPGVRRDKSGRLITNSDVIGTLDNLRGNLLPTPLIDQVAGIHDDIVNKGKDSAISISNKLLPIRKRKQSDVKEKTLKRRRFIQNRKLKSLSKFKEN